MNKTIPVFSSLVFLCASMLGCLAGTDESAEPEVEVQVETSGINGANLFDDKYFDGHLQQGKPTPILPPGKWDWNAANSDLANWQNFKSKFGSFELVKDIQSLPVGWKLLANQPSGVDFTGPSAYFEGSSGRDILDLGPQGQIHSFSGRMEGGPDLLIFNKAWALDFSTSAAQGDADDDDVVVAGCDQNADPSFDISATTIHTGSGSDIMFVRDAKQAGFDAGNLDGVTADLDPQDGDDVVVYRGNMLDFRFYGGRGNDTAVWYVDEVKQNSAWLGPNFFGGGGAGDALWVDPGTDRLVLVIPTNTKIITAGPTQPGQLLIMIKNGYSSQIAWDQPTINDPKAKYCVSCGVSPQGRKTLTFEYKSANGAIKTGYFGVTAFEEVQIGLGAGAKVYSLNDVNGTVTLNPALAPFDPPAVDPSYCAP